MNNKPNIPLIAGAAVALVLSLVIFKPLLTIVFAAIGTGVWFFVIRPKQGTSSSAVAAPVAYVAPQAHTQAVAVPSAAAAEHVAASQAPAAEVPVEELGTAVDVISAIKNECIQKGFFTRHQVKSTKAKRNAAATATMTADSKTNKNFYVSVVATQSEYGMHLNCSWGQKGQGLGSALAQNAMGSTFSNAVNAGKQYALNKKMTELEMEMNAFQQQVFNKYLA